MLSHRELPEKLRAALLSPQPFPALRCNIPSQWGFFFQQRRPITVAGPWPIFTAFPYSRKPSQIFNCSLFATAC